jgi:predicted nucleic acid-binding protein
MYVETDFLLALAKRDDWLQERAEEAVREYDDLETSVVALAEFLAVSERYDFDRTRAMANVLEIVEVGDTERQIALKAATYRDGNETTSFDAFHAATVETRGVEVLSSDGVYDRLDLRRIPLEPKQADD